MEKLGLRSVLSADGMAIIHTDGSHISCGSEVILIDPHKDIHDDENNVCS